ncbi:RDD family protein [Aquibacillus koreensis]|uniref:RDD family protein n=1 Tax=Aquibacillus koreensis TaxID=279446 RepID=A0A9X4ALE1_9BACI|nr:RDD family protein [Aquibacillus koreensis]MCT2536996.1 RDD family protein [Aquibacillus koreensis]MDC3422350.1 RDD family protein [Aquibacillus koreensis]
MENNERLKDWLKQYNEHRYNGEKHSETEEDEKNLSPHITNSDQAEQEPFIGFQKRMYAFFIDCLVLSIVVLEVSNLYLLFLIVSLYYSILPATPWKGTIGKLAIGATIVDKNGDRITFIRSMLRFYGYFFSGALCMLGFILIGLDVYKRSLHDFACGTFVVQKQEVDKRTKETNSLDV